MAGAVAAGLSGKGPAVAAVVPDEKIDDVRTKWNDHEAKILQTRVNHQKARVTS
jgi:shikimate kinase